MSNLNKIMRQLKKEVKQIEKLAMEGFDEGIQIAVGDIKRNAPVLSGDLRKSVKAVKISKTERKIVVDVPYATPVEYGTSTQPPRNYFRPAINQARTEIPERIVQKINRGV